MSDGLLSTAKPPVASSGAGERNGRLHRFVLHADDGPHLIESESQALLLQRILERQAPAGIEVSVRRRLEGWLSVLFTGLPHDLHSSPHVSEFMSQWLAGVDRYYDSRGGNCVPLDSSDLHPDVSWEHRWERYEVRHRRGMPYW